MAVKANKTQLTEASVDAFLSRVTPESRREDARALAQLMARVTGEKPRMWGPSIVGFGVRRYQTADGRDHEILKSGFSPRSSAFALYLGGALEDPLVKKLGKFTHAKSCLYLKRLTDIDTAILEKLVRRSASRNECDD